MTTPTTGITFWQRYKVFITGLIGAVVMALLPVFSDVSPELSGAGIAMAILTALSSYLANNLRGKAQSIGGIVFTVLVFVVPTLLNHGHIDYKSLIYIVLLQISVQFYAYAAPPFKPDTYEQNALIVQAKEIPPTDQVVDDSPALPVMTDPTVDSQVASTKVKKVKKTD